VTDASVKPASKSVWTALAALALVNLVWLVVASGRGDSSSFDVAAYAECRSALRRQRPDRGLIRFPTMDLIRIKHDDARYVVRGFFETKGGRRRTWYSCVASASANGWRVESLVVDE